MPSQTRGLIVEVDEQLESLVESLNAAVNTRSCVVVLEAWCRKPYFPLLPFHLNLRWAGRLAALPLTPSVGLAPFFETDFLIASTALYEVRDVLRRRTEGRVTRAKDKRFSEDLAPQDWEPKAGKHTSKLGPLTLPGTSYVAIDQVGADGDITPGHRSVLGRFAVRTGLRPSVLVPRRRATSAKTASAFKTLDLLLINAQGLRARRTVSALQAILRQCTSNVPILLLASTPTDLLPLFENGIAPPTQFHFVGHIRADLRLAVTLVGRDRPSVDREFEFAVEGLDKRTPVLADLVKSAKVAWWAARQTLCQQGTEPREVHRFLAAFDRAAIQIPVDASLLTDARRLLQRELANRELQIERLHALIEATMHVPGESEILVLVRDNEDAQELKQGLAEKLGLTTEGVEEIGVHVTGARGYWPDRLFSAVVTAGYFGNRTIDVLLASRARHLRLVLDPIEARAAWYHVRKSVDLLKSAAPADVQEGLQTMANEIARHVAAFGELIELSLMPSGPGQPAFSEEAIADRPSSPQHALIIFTDGTSLEVNLHARFEVMREAGKRLKSLQARLLEAGDQVVVLREDSHSLFSDKLLATLDHGPLARQADKRTTWLSVVKSVLGNGKRTAQSIAQTMTETGHAVDPTTVRTWLRLDDGEEASVPDRPDRFLGFAAALGITLDREVLLDLFSGIHSWRVNHRKFGRELARAVRAACLGRLDADSLRRIERDWGMNARYLVEGARVATVDEVILPEASENAPN